MTVLVTGSSGFLGRILTSALVNQGESVIAVDLVPGTPKGAQFVQLDLAHDSSIDLLCQLPSVTTIYHLASQIDFGVKSQRSLYENNVRTTSNIARLAKQVGCEHVIFTSSNSIFLGRKDADQIPHDAVAAPLDEYGRSKVRSEEILLQESDFRTSVFRCPNILDAGRAGMLSIFFDFVSEGRKCWLVGSGNNRYQCLYAGDLLEAFKKSQLLIDSKVMNIGSDSPSTIREMYESVIQLANTGARVKSLPARTSITLLKLANNLGLSPIGPYQFRMLTSNFSFDTGFVKQTLNWAPTLSNNSMLCMAYSQYLLDKNDPKFVPESANSSRVQNRLIDVLRKMS